MLLVADRRAGQRPALTQVDAHKTCAIEKDVKRDDDNLAPIKIMLLGLSICLIHPVNPIEKNSSNKMIVFGTFPIFGVSKFLGSLTSVPPGIH